MKKKRKNPVWKYVGRNWWRYIIAFTALVTSVALDIWFPLIIKSIVDDVIIAGSGAAGLYAAINL